MTFCCHFERKQIKIYFFYHTTMNDSIISPAEEQNPSEHQLIGLLNIN